MITKDQLNQLKAPAVKTPQPRYTIGGRVEAAVHSNVEDERSQRLHQGQAVMNEAVQSFRNNMAFKSREGLARGQFDNAKGPPKQDRAIAESTWQQNHVKAHEDKFERVSQNLKQDVRTSFDETRDKPQSSETVNAFKRSMQSNHQTRER